MYPRLGYSAKVALVLILFASCALSGQLDPRSKQCKLIPIKSRDHSAAPSPDPKGYKRMPVVTFQIEESGKVVNVKLKRSSGSPSIDKYALSWVRSWKYKPRPAGCGVLESEVGATIDFTSAQ